VLEGARSGAARRTAVLFTACDLHFLRVRTARKLAGKNVHVESENPRTLPANIFLYLRSSEPLYNTLALNLPAILRGSMRILPERLKKHFINSLYHQ